MKKEYRVTYKTPFDSTPQVTTVEVNDKHGTDLEQATKAIKDSFIRRTMFVTKVEELPSK